MAPQSIPEDCIDQREIAPNDEVGTVFDHTPILLSGVTRTQKFPHRPAPYSPRRATTPAQSAPSSSQHHTIHFAPSRASSPVSDHSGVADDHPGVGTHAPTSGASRIATRRQTPSTTSRVQDEWSESSDEEQKIRKPVGEVGRPNRGGYNLKQSLKWPENDYNDVREYIKRLVSEKMDCSIPFTQQPEEKIEEIKNKCISHFTFVRRYEDGWVVEDFIRSRLKYAKGAEKKKVLAGLAEKTVKRDLRKAHRRKEM